MVILYPAFRFLFLVVFLRIQTILMYTAVMSQPLASPPNDTQPPADKAGENINLPINQVIQTRDQISRHDEGTGFENHNVLDPISNNNLSLNGIKNGNDLHLISSGNITTNHIDKDNFLDTVSSVAKTEDDVNGAEFYSKTEHTNTSTERKEGSKTILTNAMTTSSLLTIWLANEGHSVRVRWNVSTSDQDRVFGFVVSYKMEGRENYDSSRLGSSVRTFIIHSLHEDEHYTICVQIIGLGDLSVDQLCLPWSKASKKIAVGIIAGCTFLLPCCVLVAWVVYKDSRMKRTGQVIATTAYKDKALYVSVGRGAVGELTNCSEVRECQTEERSDEQKANGKNGSSQEFKSQEEYSTPQDGNVKFKTNVLKIQEEEEASIHEYESLNKGMAGVLLIKPEKLKEHHTDCKNMCDHDPSIGSAGMESQVPECREKEKELDNEIDSQHLAGNVNRAYETQGEEIAGNRSSSADKDQDSFVMPQI